MLKFNDSFNAAVLKIRDLMTKTNRPVLIAIDGRSGTGKTTISQEIARHLNGVAILSDNFWVGGSDEEWDKRIPQERSNLAIDWRRIRYEVLEPLLAGNSASWHPFNWNEGSGLSEDVIESKPTKLIILDGASSSRSELQDIIDLSILVEVPDDQNRRGRLVSREGEKYMINWHKRWDPAEDYYFSKVRHREFFDIIIEN